MALGLNLPVQMKEYTGHRQWGGGCLALRAPCCAITTMSPLGLHIRGAFLLSRWAAVTTKPELAVELNFLPFTLKRSVGCGGGQPGSLDRWESLFVPSPSTMALQQAQMLLSMNSLESVNAGVQQNNTESFAVALCHLAELHAEQVGGGQVSGLLEQGRLCQFFPLVLAKGTGTSGTGLVGGTRKGESCLLPARGVAGVAAWLCSSHPVFLFRAVSLQLPRC